MIQDNSLMEASSLEEEYDYIFCGVGASASLLILQLCQNNLLQNAKVLLVDQAKKDKGDKTFCFWSSIEEPINHDLKGLISHRWSKVELLHAVVVDLNPLCYNYISSIDLYEEVQRNTSNNNFKKLNACIDYVSLDEKGSFISVNGTKIRGAKIFDSRTPVYKQPKSAETHIFQSFVGWLIETNEENIQSDAFRFMDFSIDQQGFTQFVYVLPFSQTKALVEVTRLGSEIIQVNEAENLLKKYILKNYKSYKKLNIEHGCIPMSTGEVENDIVEGITTLGARNYKIKPSTGYGFKNMYYHARELTESIKNEVNTEKLNKTHIATLKGRFAFYDTLLLDILNNQPSQGKRIFTELLKKVGIQKIFKFLDQKTSIKEDISIFIHLPWWPFVSSLLLRISKQSLFLPVILAILSLILIILGYGTTAQNTFGYSLLFIGLVTVGIPHGAVDHLLETGRWNDKKTPMFIIKYILQAVSFGFCWYYFPQFALIIFLGYSAWHFGQADGKKWGLTPLLSIVWGISVLFYILGTHAEESNFILSSMGHLSLPWSCSTWSIFPFLIWAIYKKQASFAITVIWLMLSSQIPVHFAFGLYFIGQHSLTSWQHIKSHLGLSSKKIWLQSLPFHTGAWVILLLFYLVSTSHFVSKDYNPWGFFFIFISCISLPHVIAINSIYNKNK